MDGWKTNEAKASSSIICLREPHYWLRGKQVATRHANRLQGRGGGSELDRVGGRVRRGVIWRSMITSVSYGHAVCSFTSGFLMTRTVTPYICMPCVKICNKGKLEESWGWEHAQDVNYYFGSVFYINVSFPFFSHQEMIRLGWLSSPRSKTTERSCFAEWITHLSKILLSKTPLSSMSIVSSADYMTIFFLGCIYT